MKQLRLIVIVLLSLGVLWWLYTQGHMKSILPGSSTTSKPASLTPSTRSPGQPQPPPLRITTPQRCIEMVNVFNQQNGRTAERGLQTGADFHHYGVPHGCSVQSAEDTGNHTPHWNPSPHPVLGYGGKAPGQSYWSICERAGKPVRCTNKLEYSRSAVACSMVNTLDSPLDVMRHLQQVCTA